MSQNITYVIGILLEDVIVFVQNRSKLLQLLFIEQLPVWERWREREMTLGEMGRKKDDLGRDGEKEG